MLPHLDFGPGWCPVPRKPGADCGHGAGPGGGASGAGHAWSWGQVCPSAPGERAKRLRRSAGCTSPLSVASWVSRRSGPGAGEHSPLSLVLPMGHAGVGKELPAPHLGSSVCFSSSQQDPALRQSRACLELFASHKASAGLLAAIRSSLVLVQLWLPSELAC